MGVPTRITIKFPFRLLDGRALFEHAGDDGVIIPLLVALVGARRVLHHHVVHGVVLEQPLRTLRQKFALGEGHAGMHHLRNGAALSTVCCSNSPSALCSGKAHNSW